VWSVGDDAHSVFLIVLPESVTLVDAGFPGTMDAVAEALASVGRSPGEIGDILLSHCHPDHAAGLAEVVRATGARVWMHRDDATLVRAGEAFRPYRVAPGAANERYEREIISQAPRTFEPVDVTMEVASGTTIDVAGGIKVLGTPGHTAGHLAFLWPQDGGVLFVGDAANNVGGLQLSPIYEDITLGVASLRELATEEFETACFAHGAPIVGGAADAFRKMWGGPGVAPGPPPSSA